MKSGQSLVILLVFMAVAITVTTTATMVLLGSTKSSSRLELAQDTLSVAEGGAENALMRLLRDPYYSGETLTVGDGIATISSVMNGSVNTITSIGRTGNFFRTVRVTTVTSGGRMLVTSWQEIFP